MFEASHPFLFFDYWRVPYRLAPTEDGNGVGGAPTVPDCGWLRPSHAFGVNRPKLYWPRLASPQQHRVLLPPAGFRVEGVFGYGSLIPDQVAGQLLARTGGPWRPGPVVQDCHGRVVASVWRDTEGNVFLPFDPDDVITRYWSEQYRGPGRGRITSTAKRQAVKSYYRVRPALPRPVQIALRRRVARIQARTPFPRWPVESTLHDLYGLMFRYTAALAGRPVPYIAPWPAGRSWALVLTHDVETQAGYDRMSRLRDVEVRLGYRSSWNFVPKRYDVDPRVVDELTAAGCEVGVHGLYHDGRDLESLAVLQVRVPAMRDYAARWGAVGFRSPATQRNWEWMPMLGFDYDSSYPDTDPFEPQSGGCCSWLPFLNGDLVELPITLPQDHTLFVILSQQDERVWLDKTEQLKASGGMALLITHPDYTDHGPLVAAYHRLLAAHRNDPDAWRALPRDVSAWWRRRQASHLEPAGDGWQVVGPAAGEATVSFAALDGFGRSSLLRQEQP